MRSDLSIECMALVAREQNGNTREEWLLTRLVIGKAGNHSPNIIDPEIHAKASIQLA
jgi:hypothetical protein